MKEHIPSLNGLRAISIFFVLFAHVLLKNFSYSDNPGGQVGVNIFFVISGYLITLLLLKEEKHDGSISLRSFYIRRTIRIFPIYYVLLLVYLVLQVGNVVSFTANSWITSITYTKYFASPKGGDWESGHLWSLSVEEHFYLIWPLVFKFFKKYRTYFAFFIILVVTAIRLTTDISIMHMFTRADALMWGCVFAVFNRQIINFFKSRNGFIAFIPFITLFIALIIKRAFTLMKVDNIENVITTFLGSYGLITNVCIGCIILISINYKNNVWFNFLNTAPLNYIGTLSYSIYLWQQIFFSVHLGKLSVFPYNIALIFIVALLSFYLVEKPFLSLRRKFKSSYKGHITSIASPATKGSGKEKFSEESYLKFNEL